MINSGWFTYEREYAFNKTRCNFQRFSYGPIAFILNGHKLLVAKSAKDTMRGMIIREQSLKTSYNMCGYEHGPVLSRFHYES